jgi:hypothetical protein
MVTVRPRVLLAVLLAVGAVLLAACGNAQQPGSGRGTEPTAAGPTTTEPASAAPTSPGVSTIPPVIPSAVPTSAGGGVHPGPTGIPIGTGKPVTIDGIIEAGVEPGCKILTAGNTRYLILGAQDAPMDVPVRVEGVLQPGVLSTCQQGTPLRVTSVKRR